MVTDSDKEILLEAFRKSRMAVKAINYITPKIYDEDLKDDLNMQYGKYLALERQARKKLRAAGWQPKSPTAVDEIRLWGAIQANTAFNTSTKHTADMIMQENTKGIAEMMKKIKTNQKAGDYSMEVANELMDFEEKVIERMKLYT